MLRICEIHADIWSLRPTFGLAIDRSGTTVAEYLENCGVCWSFGDDTAADIRLFKGDVGPPTVRRIVQELKRVMSRQPSITLIGEPRELASAAYLFASPAKSLAVAPGKKLKRLYFASEWIDPRLEGWPERLDKICWIARPTPDRIEIARKVTEAGVPLEIYSRQPWPLDEWKGYVEDEVETSRRYRYRIVCENSTSHGYHSEKLFNSIRSGCVTFYRGDKALDLSHLEGAWLPLETGMLKNRGEFGSSVVDRIDKFMFSSAWEIYSFKKFYERILLLAREVTGSPRESGK